MTTFMPFYDEIMTIFCANNTTNNIQNGVNSHFPGMSGGATAKSLQWMIIRMGFTIGIPSISQLGWFAGVDKELRKGRSQGVWGLPSLVWSRAKYEIRVQFLTFSNTIFVIL